MWHANGIEDHNYYYIYLIEFHCSFKNIYEIILFTFEIFIYLFITFLPGCCYLAIGCILMISSVCFFGNILWCFLVIVLCCFRLRKVWIPNMKFNCRFSFNRLPLRLQHRAVQFASENSLDNFLFPDANKICKFQCIQPVEADMKWVISGD